MFGMQLLLLFLLSTFLVPSLANKMVPSYRHDEQYDQTPESAPTEPSPWISGPLNQKYQFQIGKQSWLAAREKCLAQNADLVTIHSAEEMQWLLAHYKPQFQHLRERQVQIGLLLEAPEGDGAPAREWRWVDGKPLDVNSMKWTQGEPFDHAKGKERCALLNVHEQRVDDVDCDLGAGPGFNYRFVCQRSHEKHIQHESLNNPLWRKLEDILVFFGISSPPEEAAAKNVTSSSNGLDEEGYWDKVFKAGGNNGTTAKTALPPNHEEIGQPKNKTAGDEISRQQQETSELLDKVKEEEGNSSVLLGAAEEEKKPQKAITEKSTEATPKPIEAKSGKLADAKIIGRDEESPAVKLVEKKPAETVAASTDNKSTQAEKGKEESGKREEKSAEEKKNPTKADEGKKEENTILKETNEKTKTNNTATAEANSISKKEKSSEKKALVSSTAADLLVDKHVDGRHSSSEGLEIVTEKKAAQQQEGAASGDDPTVILLKSAEANGAQFVSGEEAAVLSSNASQQLAANQTAPILLHAIGTGPEEDEGNATDARQLSSPNDSNGTTVVQEETRREEHSSSAAKPTKLADPLSLVAQTLERSLSSSSKEEEAEEDEGKKKKKHDGRKDEADDEHKKLESEIDERKPGQSNPVQNRIKHLERIISAVQQMMGLGGGGNDEDDGVPKKKEGKVLRTEENDKGKKADEQKGRKTDKKHKEEPSVKQEEANKHSKAADLGEQNTANKNGADEAENGGGKTAIQQIAEVEEKSKSSSSELAGKSKQQQKKTRANEEDKAAEENVNNASMMAMEGDFEEAERESKAHPGINSGDLVKNIIMSSSAECDEAEGCEEEEEGPAEGAVNEGKKKKKSSKTAEVREQKVGEGLLEPLNSPRDAENEVEEAERRRMSRIEKYGRKEKSEPRQEQEQRTATEEKPKEVTKERLKAEKLEARQIVSKQQRESPADGDKSPLATGHILDQLFHRGAKQIRDGDEIPPSAEISEGKAVSDNSVKKAETTGGIEGQQLLVSKAAEDWVLPEENDTPVSSPPPSSSSSSSPSSPASVFPQPNFELIQRGVPEDVERQLLAERRRVDSVYKLFNTKESVQDLLRRIQQAEETNNNNNIRPLPVAQSQVAEGSWKEDGMDKQFKQYISSGGYVVERH